MSVLVFRLRNVPQDEADEVRALLDERGFDWYETSAGNWGIAMPGIWLEDPADMPLARKLIDEYQQERGERLRREHESNARSGETLTLAERVKHQPFQIAGIILFCLFILFVSINPFLRLIGYGV